jgi:hypothetical protein
VDGTICGSGQTCDVTTPHGGFSCRHDLPCGHVGESCCFCPTCASYPFTCGPGASCDQFTQTCIAAP